VSALAVAGEPELFWRGAHVAEIVGDISLPAGVGRLEAADSTYNGSTGRALDEEILQPLGLTRSETWLSTLVPHSCISPTQQQTIEEHYAPVAQEYDLPPASVPLVPEVLAGEDRQQAILAELRQSQAEILILLGNQPLRWFLLAFESRWKRLIDFGMDTESYGRLHPVTIAGQSIQVLPLAHPRQIDRLGRASARWFELHQAWRDQDAPTLLAN
jgi:uracil-DNA glycosylase